MSLQSSTFNTTNVMDNEIVKASDFNFAFENLINNVAKATQMFLESEQDFVINGKVLPYSGMVVQVSPIFGVCKSTGVPFGRTETAPMEYGFEESELGRVDIIEVKGDWGTYDNQQRAFNDPDTDTQTYQYVDTKKMMFPSYQIKQGVEGSGVAPEVDSGYVKLAEVVIRANSSSILATDIKNITSDVAGLDNDDWTTEKDATYNIGYITDVNARFRVAHNEDGTHQEDCIDSTMLDIGTGTNQVNGNVLPVGATVSIPEETVSASDSILSVFTKLAAIVTTFYNAYQKYGTYGFKGELKISSVDSINVLTKPISISADGSGNAVIKLDGNAVISIDSNGKLSTNGYAPSSANHIVTKALTDVIQNAISLLDTRVTNIENTSDNTVYANGTLSTGTDGRYNVDSAVIFVATTENITLSGTQNIDGKSTTSGDLILVKDQTDSKENGIYEAGSSTWLRYPDYDTPAKIKGKLFNVVNGNTNKGKMYYTPKVNFTSASSFGTDDIIFLEYFGSIKPLPSKIPMRDNNGCVKSNEPNATDDAATKIYVDPIVSSSATPTVLTGAVLKNGMSLKIMFTGDVSGVDGATPLQLSYNGVSYTVKAVKNGALIDVKAHEVSTSVFKYIQAYTTIEFIYNSGYFVIIGNPIVLSSADYVIYADGYYKWSSYSTTERWTGRFWTDGKPIYRKAFVDMNPGNSDYVFPHGISNYERLVTAYGVAGSTLYTNNYFPISQPYGSNFYTIGNVDSINITLNINGNYNRNATVVVEYTKTTDSAGDIPPFSN